MALAPAANTDSICNELIVLAREAGASKIGEETVRLRQRISEGLFYIACVGQFKRGKSTLLNVLIGTPILPVGVPPVTAVITLIRYGSDPGARIRFESEKSQTIPVESVSSYVSEKENPGNTKKVVTVEVFIPSPLLSKGMCLVDTPGIGSVFASNTEATTEFIPHIDAALVVLGTDPPVSADELALVQTITKHCRHTIFLLNKADKHTGVEIAEARGFTLEVLKERLDLENPKLFVVSALEAGESRGNTREWGEFIGELIRLASQSGAELIRKAEERHLGLLKTRLERRVQDELKALEHPIAESQKRVEALRACVSEARVSLNDLSYLLNAEQARATTIFKAKQEEFINEISPKAKEKLLGALESSGPGTGLALRRKALKAAQAITQISLDKWLVDIQPLAEARYIEITERFVKLTNSFLEKTRGSGGEFLADLPSTISSDAGFRARSRLYYTYMMTLTSQSPLGWLFDLLRTRRQQIRALECEVGKYLFTLLSINSTRIANDFDERILESRRHFEQEIIDSFDNIISSSEDALKKGQTEIAKGSMAVKARIEELKELLLRMETLC